VKKNLAFSISIGLQRDVFLQGESDYKSLPRNYLIILEAKKIVVSKTLKFAVQY